MPLPLFQFDKTLGSVASPGGRVIWTGSASDGDWSNGANWDGAAAPGQMDRVYIGTTSDDIDTGLTQTGTTLERLHLGEDWQGAISVLRINVNKLIIDKRLGDVSLNGRMPEVWIYNTGADSTAVTLDGTIGDVYIHGTRGTVTIAQDASLESLTCTPAANATIDVVIDSGVTGIGTVRAYGLTRLSLASNVTALFTDEIAEVTMTGSAAATSMELWGSSFVYYNSSATITGSIYQSATLSLRDNTNASVPFDDFVMYGGTLDLRSGTNAADH